MSVSRVDEERRYLAACIGGTPYSRQGLHRSGAQRWNHLSHCAARLQIVWWKLKMRKSRLCIRKDRFRRQDLSIIGHQVGGDRHMSARRGSKSNFSESVKGGFSRILVKGLSINSPTSRLAATEVAAYTFFTASLHTPQRPSLPSLEPKPVPTLASPIASTTEPNPAPETPARTPPRKPVPPSAATGSQ